VLGTEIKSKTSFTGVEISNMPIEITNIHIQINVSEFNNKVSFICAQ